MKKLMSIISESTVLKLDRDWVWVSGDTKPIKDDLKELGFRWSPRRKEWYHKDATSLGVTSDTVEVKAIAKTSEPSDKAIGKKSTSKAKAKSTSKAKAKSTSKSNANARSTYKYGAKRFVRDYADKEELAEILDMIIARISE